MVDDIFISKDGTREEQISHMSNVKTRSKDFAEVGKNPVRMTQEVGKEEQKMEEAAQVDKSREKNTVVDKWEAKCFHHFFNLN